MQTRNMPFYGLEELGQREQMLLGVECLDTGLSGQKSVYDIINERILEQVEKGNLVWRKGWIDTGAYQNFVTKKPYKGIVNVTLIGSVAPNAQYFMTSKQIENKGGNIRLGAKGIPIFFKSRGYFKNEIQEDANGNEQKVKVFITTKPFLMYCTIYSQFDIEGIDIPEPEKAKKETRAAIQSCEDLMANMSEKPKIVFEEANRAFFSPSKDLINMPVSSTFKTLPEYYATLFHETIHWTGAKKRLNRTGGKRFGDKAYAFEELVAELGAAYLCGYTGILFHTVKNTAAYLEDWYQVLADNMKADKTFFYDASIAAQKAAELIKGGKLEGMKKNNLGEIPQKYSQYLGDISPNFNVQKLKTATILTDTKRFQNRDEAYSAKSVARIVNDFKPEKFDPLRVWRDKNGKIYVVAGHSRLEAAHKLGLKDVPVVFLNMSETEAIEYGKYESNYLADAEKLIPRLRAFEHDQNKGMTMKALKLKYDDYNSLVNWQHLDKNGIFIKLLSMNDRSSFPHIERNAGWVGNIRKSFPQLTNLHEGEMYDLLYGIGGSKISKEMFIKIISNVVNNRRLDNTPDETPLGLDKTAKRGTQTRRDMESAQAELKRIDTEMEGWKSHRAKAITPEEKQAVQAVLLNLQKEKSMVDGNISKMLKAQTSLLGIKGKKAPKC